ncbi:gliding motility lipoprotein GldH [Lacinutrix neustonica]|uniref:Gliding motility lipoprotein GldH n=1 Tax=Lacinutrix neustonica TaxID=2980107 RepID=A0A9E8MUE5_9FLAO|nr:gliding motility lipoprotein GldH [Lacinutrix neustonica]WAC01135.1 gliding motility lipoprotein GldH [Lacinutrix neustonica]
MRSSFIFLGIIILSLTSCDAKRVFDEYQTVPNVWNKNDVVRFNIEAPDSTKAYNLFVNLRNTSDYKYSNLFLIVEMNFPHGKTLRDTLEYKMTQPDGTFLGTGLGNVKENKLWYKEGVVFNEDGEYVVSIQHGMRENGEVNGVERLEGITDIGFRIEKTK